MEISIIKNNRNRLIGLMFWIILWELLARFIGSSFLLPRPIEVILELKNFLIDKSFYLALVKSFKSIFFAYITGFILAFILSNISYKNELIKTIIELPIKIMRSTPIAAMVLMMAIWIERNYLAYTMAIIATLPLFYETIFSALNNRPKDLLELAYVFKVSKFKIFKMINLTTIKKYLKPVMISASGIAIKSGISGEIIALAQDTLGEEIYYSKLFLKSSELFAYIIIIFIISTLVDNLFERIWSDDRN